MSSEETFSEEPIFRIIFFGRARVGEVIDAFKEIRLRPEDFSSPVAMQMALSRIYDALVRSLSSGLDRSYVAEVVFQDSLGNQITFAADLGKSPPPISTQNLKVKITVEFYREE
ncbi:MAG: hypothetical protein ACP5I7_03605 [Sulfolobales archaeon]